MKKSDEYTEKLNELVAQISTSICDHVAHDLEFLEPLQVDEHNDEDLIIGITEDYEVVTKYEDEEEDHDLRDFSPETLISILEILESGKYKIKES